MSKRKLTRRQRWRIDKIQDEKRLRAQKSDAALPDDAHLGGAQAGLIISHFGKQVSVEDTAGRLFSCHFRANLHQLVAGDNVTFQPPSGDGTGIVVAIEPRQNLLSRPDNYGNLKPVAANLDRLLIVVAAQPAPSSQLIDRYLVAAELAGITPCLLLNKADLTASALDEMLTIYTQLGYPLLRTSALENSGIESLRHYVKNQRVAFVGQSGVGKSSLINALLPDAALATNVISDTSGLGQHTTVTARLVHLGDGASLIDSPGVREFGLWHISEAELLSGYIELAEFAGHCRFRNCSHHHEPGCALHQAVEDGQIHPQRLANFFAIADTLDEDSRARY